MNRQIKVRLLQPYSLSKEKVHLRPSSTSILSNILFKDLSGLEQRVQCPPE